MSFNDGIEYSYAVEKICRFIDNERWLLLDFHTVYDVARAFIPGARMYIVPSYERGVNYICIYIVAPKIKGRQRRRLEKWYNARHFDIDTGKYNPYVHLHIEERGE